MDIKQHLKQERIELVNHLKSLTESGRHDEVLRIVEPMLFENEDDHAALFYAASALNGTHHKEVAYLLSKRLVALSPEREEVWQQMGHIADLNWKYQEALYSYTKAFTLNPNNHQNVASMASAYVGLGMNAMAKVYAQRALELNPDCEVGQVNLAFAKLALGEFEDAWDGYDRMVGHKNMRRKATAYTNPPKFWDGKDRENVVIYGEQGIGDEIMFASCMHDAIKDTNHIVIDCHKKLEGLFKRSFPWCSVYGTRHEEAPAWMADEEIDSSCSIGTLPKFYRRGKDTFPRKPYLVADRERKRMYKALLDGLGSGLKVGIAWSGGNNYGGLRQLEPERLQDLVKSFPGVHWVSLQYKNTPTLGLPIHHWPYATETNDYDDTAALVDELDLIITVPQAVAHLAGALGKECWVMTPDATRWIYGVAGQDHTWYGTVRLFRGWDDVIDNIKASLTLKVMNTERKVSNG
jgi:hypothetical protein